MISDNKSQSFSLCFVKEKRIFKFSGSKTIEFMFVPV